MYRFPSESLYHLSLWPAEKESHTYIHMHTHLNICGNIEYCSSVDTFLFPEIILLTDFFKMNVKKENLILSHSHQYFKVDKKFPIKEKSKALTLFSSLMWPLRKKTSIVFD